MELQPSRHHKYFIFLIYFYLMPAWGGTAISPSQIAVLKDELGQYTIETLTSPALAAQFTLLDHAFSGGYSRSIYWFKLTYPQEQVANQELWLEIQPPYLDDITLYVPTRHGWIAKKGGDNYPQSSKDLPYRGSVFRLDNWQGNELYLRLQTSSSSVLIAQLWQPERFAQVKQLEYGLFGFYYGAFFLIFIIIMLQGAWRYDTVHRLYLINMAMALMFMLGLNGFIANHLFPHQAWIGNHWTPFFSMVGCATNALFYQKLLGITQRNLALWILFRATFWLTLLAAFSPFIDIYNEVAGEVHLVVTIMAIAALLRSIWLCYYHKTESKALILGHTLFLFGILSAILALLGWLPGNIWVLHGPQLGNILSMLVFGFILIKRIREVLDKQKEAEQRARLAELEREKEQRIRREHAYLADMLSHELKTPLGMIDGAVQSLAKLNPHPQEEETKRYHRIRRGVARIDNLINQLLHYERLDNGTLQPNHTPIRLQRFCQELIANHSAEHRIHLHCPPGLHLNADPILLSICVGNLLSNALRYTPAGSPIQLTAGCNKQNVLMTVQDTGPGIEESLKEIVFERYVRGNARRDVEGSGLGLYISRRIAHLHQGQLEVLPVHGSGACFQLTLPQTNNKDAYTHDTNSSC